MKIRIIMLVISFILINYLTASCNKNEVIKMIDKGFSKLEIQSICGFSKKTRTKIKVQTNSKWIAPSQSKCKSYSGKIYEGGCLATWNNSKKICLKLGARLPNIDELKKVVVDCGGIIDNYKQNPKNSSYKSCFNKKGFLPNIYWSYNYFDNSEKVWIIGFDDGLTNWGDISLENYVHCIKDI